VQVCVPGGVIVVCGCLWLFACARALGCFYDWLLVALKVAFPVSRQARPPWRPELWALQFDKEAAVQPPAALTNRCNLAAPVTSAGCAADAACSAVDAASNV